MAEQIEAEVKREDCGTSACAILALQPQAGQPMATESQLRLCGQCALDRVVLGESWLLVQPLPALTIQAKEK